MTPANRQGRDCGRHANSARKPVVRRQGHQGRTPTPRRASRALPGEPAHERKHQVLSYYRASLIISICRHSRSRPRMPIISHYATLAANTVLFRKPGAQRYSTLIKPILNQHVRMHSNSRVSPAIVSIADRDSAMRQTSIIQATAHRVTPVPNSTQQIALPYAQDG